MIGVYRIRNKINNKSYYGSSINIEKRWIKHKRELNSKTHINIILQRAWIKYGESNFEFEIIEECLLEELIEKEQKYLDLNPDYNIGRHSSGGDNLTNNPNRDEIIEKIKESVRFRYNSMSDEEIKAKHSKPMEKNPNWRGGTSFIYCSCGVRIGYNRINCAKCRPRNGKYNPFYGKKHSKNTIKKLSLIKKGKYNGNQNLEIIINGIIYKSYGEASKALKIPLTTIRWRVLSKNIKYKNYQYKDKQKICYTLEEQKKRKSKQKGHIREFCNKPFTIDGVEYRTLKSASEILGIHQMTIKGRLKSDNFDNYQYIFE